MSAVRGTRIAESSSPIPQPFREAHDEGPSMLAATRRLFCRLPVRVIGVALCWLTLLAHLPAALAAVQVDSLHTGRFFWKGYPEIKGSSPSAVCTNAHPAFYYSQKKDPYSILNFDRCEQWRIECEYYACFMWQWSCDTQPCREQETFKGTPVETMECPAYAPAVPGWHICWAPFDPRKDCPDYCTGNPINAASGIKRQLEIDFANGSLSFQRTFAGYEWWGYESEVGRNWTSNYHSRRVRNFGATTEVERGDSRRVVFYGSSGIWSPDPDVADRLTELKDSGGLRTGWTYYDSASENTERYDVAGRLASVASRAGAVTQLAYDTAGLLLSVTDPFGRAVTFTYDARGRMATMAEPGGGRYDYAYDDRGNLLSVTYPADDTGVRAVRSYLYEDTRHPSFLTGVVDENGWRFASYSYDANGLATSTRHHAASGIDVNQFTLVYTTPFVETAVTDPLGTSRNYKVSLLQNAARITSVSEPCSSCGSVNASRIEYDGFGNVSSRIDFNGNRTCYWYDTARNLEVLRIEGLRSDESCSTSPPAREDVRKTSTVWHPAYRVPTTVVEPAAGGSRSTTFEYDAYGNLTRRSVTAPKNDGGAGTVTRTWTLSYGTYGRVATVTDPVGYVTRYAYYADNDVDVGKRGNLFTITNPLGHVTTFQAYDRAGRLLRMSDPNGLVTTTTYDGRGRIASRTIGTETTRYGYDAVGQLTSVTLPDGSRLSFSYDGAHRLVQLADGLGNRVVFTLDAAGNRVREDVRDPADALARTRTRVYDALSRLSREIGATGQQTDYAYDHRNNLIAKAESLGRTTTWAYDALDRMIRQVDPSGGIAQYSYDAANELARLTDPRQLATTYTSDGLGNPRVVTSPDTGQTLNEFDASGNRVRRTDARGAVATFRYDGLHRLIESVHSRPGSASETHSYTYDVGANAKGRLTRLTDPAATTTWTYDAAGRVATKTQAIAGAMQTVSYGYNSAGQLASIILPSGQRVAYGYTNNRVTSIAVNGTTIVAAVVYEPFGDASAWRWGNGTHTLRNFDDDGRMSSWEFRNGASILRNVLSFDAAGRITSMVDALTPTLSTAYQYDAMDRLTLVQRGSPASHRQEFSYDSLGNRIAATIDGNGVTLAYEPTSNRLQSMKGVVSPTYLNAEASLSFVYNNANRLVAVQNGRGVLATYSVNGLGQRVQKVAGKTTTRFVYDEQGRLVGEYDGSGKMIQETVWLDDLPIATLRPGGNGASAASVAIYYVHADHLGTPRAVTRPSDNAIVWRWDNIEAFGSNPSSENLLKQTTFKYNLRFPGQYFDAETGMHYNYFRDYDPGVGRYAQSDPIGLSGGLNTYSYAAGNPGDVVDPLGLTVFSCTQPLALLGGSGMKSGPDVPGNPLYHNYLCVHAPDGSLVCGGQDRGLDARYGFGTGKPSKDTYSDVGCRTVSRGNGCTDSCVVKRLLDPNRPNYWLFGGGGRRGGAYNCQQWAARVLSDCASECATRL